MKKPQVARGLLNLRVILWMISAWLISSANVLMIVESWSSTNPALLPRRSDSADLKCAITVVLMSKFEVQVGFRQALPFSLADVTLSNSSRARMIFPCQISVVEVSGGGEEVVRKLTLR